MYLFASRIELSGPGFCCKRHCIGKQSYESFGEMPQREDNWIGVPIEWKMASEWTRSMLNLTEIDVTNRDMCAQMFCSY